MAEPTTITTGAETPEAMVADRQKFWNFFTGGLTASAAVVAVILILLWLFLVA
jgi:hypothetical protein